MDCNYAPKSPCSRLLHVVTHRGSARLQLWLVSTKGNHTKAKAFGSPTQISGKIVHYCLYKFINVCSNPQNQFPHQLPTLFTRQCGRYSRWAVGIGSDLLRKVWVTPKITCYIIHRPRWKEGRDWGGDVICQDSLNACVLNHGICNESCSPATLTVESKQNVLLPKSIFYFGGIRLRPSLFIPFIVYSSLCSLAN